MKTIIAVAISLAVFSGVCLAQTSTWKVATVHGSGEFALQDSGDGGSNDQLHYNTQPNTSFHWYENNGAPDGTLAMSGGQPRAGQRTFAMTDAAYGATLDSLKLTFEYTPQYPTINFFITDGQGHYGIFSPASGGVGAATSTVVDLGDGYTRRTLDLTSANTNLTDTTGVAIYEHNGFVSESGTPYTSIDWGVIKNFTIAGMYDYQRSPEGGWEGWGDFFNPVSQQGGGQELNEYGVALIWGSTVSNSTYSEQTRTIRNVQLEVGSTSYDAIFADGGTASASGAQATITGSATADPVRNWVDESSGIVMKAKFNLDAESTMDFTATRVTDQTSLASAIALAVSEGQLDSSDTEILQIWSYDTNNYNFGTGESVSLSFDMGQDIDLGQIHLWHNDGTGWDLVDLTSLGIDATVDNGLVTFSGITNFSDYGVSVPEPTSMALLGLGGIALLRRRRNRKNA